jgi:hypothetical protein
MLSFLIFWMILCVARSQAGRVQISGGGGSSAMDVVATWPAAAYLPAPATVPQALPSLPVTPHQVRKGAQPLSL